MLRRSILIGLAAATFACLGLAAACGGSDKKDQPTATAEVAAIPEKSPTRVRPTRIPATAVPATGPALFVGASGKPPYVPTVDEFRALPTTVVKGQSGVTLAVLADKAGLASATTATIDGVPKGSDIDGVIRYPMKDIASTTILVIDDTGHISIVSDVIPETEWLTLVASITLQ
jgi:hypothetical protein